MGVDSFPKNMVMWLKSHLPTFYELHSDTRPDWLKEISETTMVEFGLPKEQDTRNADQYRKDIPRWFRNKNNPAARKKYHKVNTSSEPLVRTIPTKVGQMVLPGFQTPKIPAPRTLYGQAKCNASRITAVARERHEADKKIPYVKHWNNVLSEEWNQLSEEERSLYHEEFQAKKAKLMERPTEADIYTNQMNLIEGLPGSLQDLLGFEMPHQSGNMLLHVQGVYRGQEDRLKTFSFVVYPPGIRPLNTEDEYHNLSGYTRLIKPWTDFAKKILPDNSFPREDAIPESESDNETSELTYDIEGSPLLPRLPFERMAFARILRKYIIESWSRHWDSHDTPIPFTWRAFVAKPEEYILPSCIPNEITIDDPVKMDSASLQSWYTHLVEVQEHHTELKEAQLLFRGHKHLLSLQYHQHIERTDLQECSQDQASTLQDEAYTTSSTPLKRHPKPRPIMRSPSIRDSSPVSIRPPTVDTPMPLSIPAATVTAHHASADRDVLKDIEQPSQSVGNQTTVPKSVSGNTMSVIEREQSADPVAECNENPVPETSGCCSPDTSSSQPHVEKDPSAVGGRKRKRSAEQEASPPVEPSQKKTKRKNKDIEAITKATNSSTSSPRRSSRVPKPRKNPNDLSTMVVTTVESPATSLVDGSNIDHEAAPKRPGRPRGHRETFEYV